MALTNLRIYYTWKIIKSAHNNDNCKISAPTWNDEFGFPGGYYSIVDIPDYFEFIIKKYESLTENAPVEIYLNKIKNKIVLKVKRRYNLELLSSETMKLLRTTKKDVVN